MAQKIDSSTVVPLGWVLGGLATIVAGVAAGVFWISTVNFRLQRIEKALHLDAVADMEIVTSAKAGGK